MLTTEASESREEASLVKWDLNIYYLVDPYSVYLYFPSTFFVCFLKV